MTEPVSRTEPLSDSAAHSADAANPSSAATTLTGLVIGAGQASIAAEAAASSRPLRVFRRPTGHERRVLPSPPAPVPAPTTQTDANTGAPAAEQTAPDTTAELRNWIKDNAALLSNASLLISVAALALNLLPDTGVLDPYIKALIFAAALLLLIEMHYQWPDDLQLHTFRHRSLPQNHSWRMVAFALTMQVVTIVFAVWATLNTPLILAPLTALGVVVAFRQWYFRRFRGIAARGVGILALVLALVLSELLILIVWAVVADQNVTIQLWAENRPGFTVEVAPEP